MKLRWQDELEAIRLFHERKVKEYGPAQIGRSRNNGVRSGWSIEDTASHFSLSYFTIHQYLKLADYLGTDEKLISSFSNITSAMRAMNDSSTS